MTNEEILKHIPNINKHCLHYIFEDLKLQHKKILCGWNLVFFLEKLSAI